MSICHISFITAQPVVTWHVAICFRKEWKIHTGVSNLHCAVCKRVARIFQTTLGIVRRPSTSGNQTFSTRCIQWPAHPPIEGETSIHANASEHHTGLCQNSISTRTQLHVNLPPPDCNAFSKLRCCIAGSLSIAHHLLHVWFEPASSHHLCKDFYKRKKKVSLLGSYCISSGDINPLLLSPPTFAIRIRRCAISSSCF